MRQLLYFVFLASTAPGFAAADDDIDRLIAALLADTPVVDDLRYLTDEIGGRPTGSDANVRAVAWTLDQFRRMEVAARAESFTMPRQWEEKAARARISGGVAFDANVVAKPFSGAADGRAAPLLDAGFGTADDVARLGDAARGAWLLVETAVLDDEIGLAGLFAEFADAAAIDGRLFAAGAAGIVYMSSRPKNLVYRHPASRFAANTHPLLVMEREHAQRAQRLLRAGNALTIAVTLDVESGGGFEADNVIAEIPGRVRPDEIVLFGAHLDSHDLGTGALDNAVNVAMLMDIARQITRLGLQPQRTIRIVLWNGEEQGLVGSWKYTDAHDDELDQHVIAASFDIGSGRTVGFFTGGRGGLLPLLDRYLGPVTGLGPFSHANVPVVGTDNFDFMIEGVPNLVAIQADANYASNYHAESDTFDKVDLQQLRLNAAIAAAVIWGFANDSERLPRQSNAEIRELMNATDLEQQMRNFAVWDGWANGTRGRHDD